jgi:chemotaxis protein CheZ
MACGFQDLTGQRIKKVVNTLHYMERRVAAMVEIWGVETGTATTEIVAMAEDDVRPDKELLHGPQAKGEGVSQADIDALFD